ncbi:MAG: hypothetical protein E3J86_14085 [Candidatus Thorarchaeota archaeon]|nr:MAG: hypothetical protein E3J86_14085 [Candidatus Thorarchaeota archaeon]
MVRDNELKEYLAKQWVKRITALSSFIGLFGAVITFLAGEEQLFVIILLGIGFIFGILRLAAET